MSRILASLAQCPYCSGKLPKPPTRGHLCPICQNRYYVRSDSEGVAYVVTEDELNKTQNQTPSQFVDLWESGKFWEIFGFSDDSFNSIRLGSKYAELLSSASPAESQIIDSAYSVLNAPISRHIYLLCREVMNELESNIGKTKYRAKARIIWHQLWAYCSNGWREPTPDVVNDIKVNTGLSRPSIQPKEKTSEEYTQELVAKIKSLDERGFNKTQIAEALSKEGIPFTTAMQWADAYFNAKTRSRSSGCGEQIMGRVIGFIALFVIIWVVGSISDCESCATSNSNSSSYTYSPPTTTPYQVSNTGVVTGRVYFTDGTPAVSAEIYLFIPNTYSSYKGTKADSSGAFRFSSIPAGTYEIYVTADPRLSTFSGLPNNTIVVYANMTSPVSAIYIKKPAN